MRVRSRTTVIAGVLVLGMAGLLWGVYLASPREPSYQGKTLSEWIAPFCRQTAKGLDAPGGPQHFEELQPVRNAVRQIGTNAIPFLIARLNHRESGLHRRARQLMDKQPYAALRLNDPNVSKIRAIRALANLGAAAEPAIPSLKAQVTDAALSEHAVYALSGISVEGMRALVEQYTNVPVPFRMLIAVSTVSPSSIDRGENANYVNYATNVGAAAAIIECLCRIVQDRAMGLRISAIQRLGEFGPNATNAVPVLLPMLNDQSPFVCREAIRALGDIRSKPEVVVPALTNLLNDPDPGTQMAAASALRKFGYDAPSQLQVPRVMHPAGDTKR